MNLFIFNTFFNAITIQIQLKEKFRDTHQGGLFGGLLRAEQFVTSKLPASYDQSVSTNLNCCNKIASSFFLLVAC